MTQLASPSYLWLLLLALPLVVLALRFDGKRNRELEALTGADGAVAHRLPGYTVKSRLLLTAASVLLVLTLTGPRWGTVAEERRSRGIDILVALDVSRSMLADDLGTSRLAAAKEAVAALTAGLQGDRIGLIAFAGSAFPVCPLTTDYGAFTSSLAETGVDSIPLGGSSLAAALEEASKVFAGGEGKGRVLIVISDGEDHRAGYGAPARRLKDAGVALYPVAAGTLQGGLIPVGRGEFLKDRGGNVVKSRLQRAPLADIAAVGGGRLLDLAAGRSALTDLYRQELASLERKEFTGKGVRLRERFQVPLALALVLLVLEPLLGCWRKR